MNINATLWSRMGLLNHSVIAKIRRQSGSEKTPPMRFGTTSSLLVKGQASQGW
jgi:hypothetical protein